jgi:hypothetical protein
MKGVIILLGAPNDKKGRLSRIARERCHGCAVLNKMLVQLSLTFFSHGDSFGKNGISSILFQPSKLCKGEAKWYSVDK